MNRKKIAFSIAAVFLGILTSEIMAYATGIFLQTKAAIYRVPSSTESMPYDVYISQRDPVLGWPSQSEFGKESGRYDESGSRYIPSFADPKEFQNFISLYGDSFTYGQGLFPIAHEDAWSNILSKKFGRRVANFGVGGYGTDQSFLRFRENTADAANIVVLGHYSGDIIRNLTRNRDLLTLSRDYALKPRFTLNERGDLELIPIPDLTEDEYERFVGAKSPRLFLEHEDCYPGGPAGLEELRFPFSFAILKAIPTYKLRARLLQRKSVYFQFYQPKNKFKSLEITGKIIAEFVRTARERDKIPVVLLIPYKGDLEYFEKSGEWSYQKLIEILEDNEINYANYGDFLIEYCRDNQISVSGPMKDLLMPDTHYNEKGNWLAAEFLHSYLVDEGYVEVFMASKPDVRNTLEFGNLKSEKGRNSHDLVSKNLD